MSSPLTIRLAAPFGRKREEKKKKKMSRVRARAPKKGESRYYRAPAGKKKKKKRGKARGGAGLGGVEKRELNAPCNRPPAPPQKEKRNRQVERRITKKKGDPCARTAAVGTNPCRAGLGKNKKKV